jgi:hypothetical protein
MVTRAIVARGAGTRRSCAPGEHETEPASAGPADRTGNRVARAAGKKQTRRKSAKRRASSARAGKPRAGAKPRVTAKKRVTKARATAAKRPAKKLARPVRRKAVAVRARKAVAVHARKAAVGPGLRAGTVPPAFAAQRAHATSREELLFELARARASVKAAIQGLTAASALKPIAPGKWSVFEIVLHLGERDRVRLGEFHRTLSGQRHTWSGVGDSEQARVNEQHMAPLRAFSWDSAVRRLDELREALLLRLNEVPAQPDDVWQRGHTFAEMMWGLPAHDRHHASQIKKARIGEAED